MLAELAGIDVETKQVERLAEKLGADIASDEKQNTDPLGAEQAYGLPDGLGAGGLAGVRQAAQPGGAGGVEVRLELRARHPDLRTAEPEPHQRLRPVVQGDGWEQLKKGVGQNAGSANPGQNGNVVLSAHNDVYGELFRYLDKLAPGDQVILYTQQRQYVYVVDRTAVVEPTAVEVMASTGSPTVTLISCYPYLVDKQRIVVFARLQN